MIFVYISRLVIVLILLKAVIVVISYNLARQVDGQSPMSLPTFGKWNPQGNGTQEPTTNNYNNNANFAGGYQQA